jgi:hypothetical protein
MDQRLEFTGELQTMKVNGDARVISKNAGE